MARGDQINFRPHFKNEGPTLPCDGAVGDLYVFTKLDEGEPDPSPQGEAQLWFCIRALDREGDAMWARVAFDFVTTCKASPPKSPHYPDREG